MGEIWVKSIIEEYNKRKSKNIEDFEESVKNELDTYIEAYDNNNDISLNNGLRRRVEKLQVLSNDVQKVKKDKVLTVLVVNNKGIYAQRNR